MNNDFSFPKNQRLKSRKKIAEIFEKGNTLWSYPVQLIWKKFDESSPGVVQVAFVAPKRKIKKATDRNKIKRRLREAYRIHKSSILPADLSFGLMFIYQAQEMLSYSQIEKSVRNLIHKFQKSATQ